MKNEKENIIHCNRHFLIYVLIWLVFGLVVLMSASGPVAYKSYGDAYYLIKKQILVGLLPGIILLIVAIKLKYTFWKKNAWLFYGISLLLLILVFIPGIGVTINGSHSWIGFANHTFQPSELAKLSMIIITAALLSQSERNLSDWQSGLLPVLAVLAPGFLLILAQPDLGTLSILTVIIFAMLFLANVPKQFLLILGLIGLVGFGAMVLAAPYRLQRFTTFLHPELDPQGKGYQINQSFLAVGSGGFWGMGLGHSRQKFQYLPEVEADSIFAVVAEELGFLISGCFIFLILLTSWQGLKISKNAPDNFGRLLVGGIIVWIGWQSFLNIGAIIGVLPLTGVPLPFVSSGGSALLTLLLAVGIILSVSRQE